MNSSQSLVSQRIQSFGLGWLLSLAVLGLILTLNLLFIAIPLYGSGIHLMRAGEIWEANNTTNLVGWYFLYHDFGFYTWALTSFGLYFYVAIPLFTALNLVAVVERSTLRIPHRIALGIICLLFVFVTFMFVTSFNSITAWLGD